MIELIQTHPYIITVIVGYIVAIAGFAWLIWKAPRGCCKKCGGEMAAGKAIEQTFTGGLVDFPGDKYPVTLSVGGPGKLVDCMKCKDCGWSVT